MQTRTAVRLLLATHALLLAFLACRQSFTWTEFGLLPSGIVDWNYSDGDAYRVNPPPLRMWATLPLVLAGIDVPYLGAPEDVRRRCEWDTACSYIDVYKQDSLLHLMIARWMCIPICVMGAYLAYRLASDMYGKAAGIGGLTLWCFSPTLLAFGSFMGADAASTGAGIGVLLAFRKWTQGAKLHQSLWLGLAVGAAVMLKFTWLILFGLLPGIWIFIRFFELLALPTSARVRYIQTTVREGFQLALAFALAILVINVPYGFSGSFKTLESYSFISKKLGSEPGRRWEEQQYSGNAFQSSILGKCLVPFPEDMVKGIDLQKWDFDRERWSYFCGQWQRQGWWDYYIWGLTHKVPLGLVVLVVIGGATIGLPFELQHRWQDHAILLIPGLAILLLASLETGVSRHIRYVIPVIGIAIIWSSRVFSIARTSRECRIWFWAARISLVWFVTSSLAIFPHCISHFNELILGPRNASLYVNASNLDWGQDLIYVRQWQDRHPEARPIFLKWYLFFVQAEHLGIHKDGEIPSSRSNEHRLQPGWYIIDQESLLSRGGPYAYFNKLEPVDRIGYSFNVYYIVPQTSDPEIHPPHGNASPNP